MCCLRLTVLLFVVIAAALLPLEAAWWQGIAGIAQILAAIFAVVTILQARKTIEQADKERRFSVAPDWGFVGTNTPITNRFKPPPPSLTVTIEFVNMGFGPARRVGVFFQPDNMNEPTHISWSSGEYGVVPSGRFLRVSLTVHKGKPLDGSLSIECTTRFGDGVTRQFRVQTLKFVPGGLEGVHVTPIGED